MVTDEIIDIDNLYLNKNNYRIDFERYKAIEELIDRLYEDEDIIGMIKGIVNFQGLYPNERIIVIPSEENKYTVMEGNRRILAVKSIFGKIPIPDRYKNQVKELSSKLRPEVKDNLKALPAVVFAPNDESYLKIIADKHSTISYQRWGQISQWHFFKDLYEEKNRNLEATAEELGKGKSEIANYIRYYNLITYIRSLPYWDEKKLRNEIEKNTLKATKFTRPLGFKAITNALNIDFDDNMELIVPNIDKDEFNAVLCEYAAAALIYDKNNDDYIYTRSKQEDVLDLIHEWKEQYNKKPAIREGQTNGEVINKPPQNNTANQNVTPESRITNNNQDKNGRNPKSLPPYFKKLKVSKKLCNEQLEHIVSEISNITVTKFPLATLMLTRALIERSLIYRMKEKSIWPDFMITMQHYKNSNGNEIDRTNTYTLDDIVGYCINNVNNLFSDKKDIDMAKKALSKIQDKNGIRQYLNEMVHESFSRPSAQHVQDISDYIRELIQKILLKEG